MQIVKSKNGIPIRLTEERWIYITIEHSELSGYYDKVLEAVEEPDIIYSGSYGEQLATKKTDDGKTLVVVYKEMNVSDGFIITAFLNKREEQLKRRKILWQQ